MMERPGSTNGLRHVALFVEELDQVEHFYVDLMGMTVEWRPDDNSVYLTSGNDNLALHRVAERPARGALDHVGFFINQIEDIDRWFDFLKANGVKMQTEPRTHRDGARSFYCEDPAGNRVQVIYHIPIASAEG